MQRFRRLIALCVLALWLPATLHCALEAAGFATVFSCGDAHESGPHDDTARDACDVIEGAALKLAANTATVPVPVSGASLLFLIVPVPTIDLTPPTSGVSEFVGAPPEVARTWHFIARAAPPPRAPSAVA